MKKPADYPSDKKKAIPIAWQCIAHQLRGHYPDSAVRSIHTLNWENGYELAKQLERHEACIHAQDIAWLDQLASHIDNMLKKQVWDWLHLHPEVKPPLHKGQAVWFQTVRNLEHLALPMIPNIGHARLMGIIQETSHQGLDQCRLKLPDCQYCYIAPWWDSDTEVGIQPIWDKGTPFLTKAQSHLSQIATASSHAVFSHQ